MSWDWRKRNGARLPQLCLVGATEVCNQTDWSKLIGTEAVRKQWAHTTGMYGYGSISKWFSMIWVAMNGGIDVQSCQVMAWDPKYTRGLIQSPPGCLKLGSPPRSKVVQPFRVAWFESAKLARRTSLVQRCTMMYLPAWFLANNSPVQVFAVSLYVLWHTISHIPMVLSQEPNPPKIQMGFPWIGGPKNGWCTMEHLKWMI